MKRLDSGTCVRNFGRPALSLPRSKYTPRFESLEQRQLMAVDVILEWNDVMLQANPNDYASESPEQSGAVNTTRAMAIVSGAMYDAYNSVENIGDQFLFTAKRGRGVDVEAAVAQAAHDTLVKLYPSQKPLFDAALNSSLERLLDGDGETNGRRIGAEVAFAILSSKMNSPNSQPLANAIHGFVTTDLSALSLSEEIVSPESWPEFVPSEMDVPSADETLAMGEETISSTAITTEDQALMAQFWSQADKAQAGTPQLLNEMVRTISEQEGISVAENARLFALVNFAMADTVIVAKHNLPPGSAIPPIEGMPAVSEQAAMGAAALEVVERFLGRDNVSFTVIAETIGAGIPDSQRDFDSLEAVKREFAESRIHVGSPLLFRSMPSLNLGDSIGEFVMGHSLAANRGPNSDPWNPPERIHRHNGFDPEDVNDDGQVNPLDALALINAINAKDNPRSVGFMDVNDDGNQSPLDALQVINRLNRASGSRVTQPPIRPQPPNTQPTGVRSFDGTGNNIANPEWGSTDEQLIRVAPNDYGDGISTPAGADRPSAREISNTLSSHSEDLTKSDRDMSAYIYVWGQFIDHDLGLTKSGTPRESFNIAVPTGDPSFDPNSTGTQIIPLSRSIYDTTTGTSTSNPRQQITQVSAWIDGSMVYGSDTTRAAALRSFVGGKLKSQDTEFGEFLPLNSDGLTMANDSHRVPNTELFLAGDIRANENIELTAVQTLFVREHNRIASDMASRQPTLTDEQIFQKTREIVIAELQAITYNQWLPALIGSGAVAPYRGYNPNVNPGIANEFSTASYRLHSSINDDVEFFDDEGRPESFTYVNDAGQTIEVDGGVSLSDAFFNPTLFKQTGLEGILKYAASTKAEEIDTKLVDSLRNFLFGAPGQGGLDLAALNIQRGRDHGLADYNTVRASYGLPRVTSFSQITSDTELQSQLQSLYGTVDNIDAWVGFLAEDHARGSSVGPTSQRIIADQFQRLRDGDRFWYERVFSGRQLAELQRTTLDDVIERNTGITSMQSNVFFFRAEVSGQVFLDGNGNAIQERRERNVPQVTIQLLDDAGEVIDQTVTDRMGQYRFDSIPETGDFQVRVTPPAGMVVTTSNVLDAHIKSGEVRVGNLNFGVRPVTPPPGRLMAAGGDAAGPTDAASGSGATLGVDPLALDLERIAKQRNDASRQVAIDQVFANYRLK